MSARRSFLLEVIKMLVRRADKKDKEKIMDLLLQVLMIHCKGRPDLFKPNCRKYNDEELENLIQNDDKPIFVCEDSGEVLGYAFCVIRDIRNINNMRDMKTLYIDDLCVDENSRGRHVGTTLYDYVKKYARDIGCYNITLNVWECNPSARLFYEKMGLVPQCSTMEEIL